MDSPINEKAESVTATESRRERRAAFLLDRAITFWLFAMAIAAPHSIAATQLAWGCGLILWGARFLLRPRPAVPKTPIDYALLGLFVLTVISALFSYERATSVGKLRAASLFTIVYLVVGNIHGRRVLRLLAHRFVPRERPLHFRRARGRARDSPRRCRPEQPPARGPVRQGR
jgi:hypothetical protein